MHPTLSLIGKQITLSLSHWLLWFHVWTKVIDSLMQGIFLGSVFLYLLLKRKQIVLPLKIHWFEISYIWGWTNYLIFPLINQTLITLTNSCEKVAEVVKSRLKEHCKQCCTEKKNKSNNPKTSVYWRDIGWKRVFL